MPSTLSRREPVEKDAPLLRRRRYAPRPKRIHDPATTKMYRPGQPIGYLSAQGTPYQKKYLTRRLGFFCVYLVTPVMVVALVIILVPVLFAIADHTLSVVQMQIHEANLTSLTNTSFALSISGGVLKASIFPATLYFRAPVEVYWISPPPAMKELKLGSFNLGRVNVASGHGKVIQVTTFEIADVDAFGQFAEFLIGQPRFAWKLTCNDTHAEALGFMPTYKNFAFEKHVNFQGIDNFKDVELVDFQLPGNDPAGGISFQALTILVNPSPFSVQLGTLSVNLYHHDLFMGPSQTSGPVNITSGPNTILLVGRILPWHDNETALGLLSDVFTKYINGDRVPIKARGASATDAQGVEIPWLARGIRALELNVPLQTLPPIDPIRTIVIEEFSIVFTEDRPWQPTAFSNRLKGVISLPFGFQLNIAEAKNSIALLYNNSVVGEVKSPYSNSSLELDIVSQGYTEGTLSLGLLPSPLTIGGNQTQEILWNEYADTLVFGVDASTRLQGRSSALTDTPVGRILLDPIQFDVDSGLMGLQGLTKYPTTIRGVDVVGGDAESLHLSINTTIINPSNLNLSTGTAHFRLVKNAVLGTVTMTNLHLDIGENNVTAQALFDPKVAPEGQETLDRFVSGLDTVLYINGFDGSSAIPSLNPSLAKVRLNATLPGLERIVSEANLTVPPNISIDNTTLARVTIINPFTSDLDITSIQSSPVYNNLSLGLINATLSPPIHAIGKAVTVSQSVPLQLNTRPKFLVDLFFQLAESSNTSLGPWPPWLQRILDLPGDAATQVKSMPGGDASSCSAEGAFDLQRAMLTALAGLAVDIPLLTDAAIGEYTTVLNFTQSSVPIRTDDTALYLLGPAGAPLIQEVVGEVGLSFSSGNITNVTDSGFMVHLSGSLETDVPTNALIVFPDPLEVRWNGNFIATISLPPICTIPGQGVPVLLISGQVNITDAALFTEFASHILHNDQFTWEISSSNVTVIALGVTFTEVSLSKNVSFAAFNGLPGVSTTDFDVPGQGEDYLEVAVGAAIPSTATVGIELNTARFRLFFNETDLGTAQADDLFLAPSRTTSTLLKGQLMRQDTQRGLDNLGVLFSKFLQGNNVSLVVQGLEVETPYQRGPVRWLSDAFKTLHLNVSLQGRAYQVIFAIALVDLDLTLTADPAEVAYDIPVSSTRTVAMYANPFHFTLSPIQAGVSATVVYENTPTAELNLPMLDVGGESSSGPERQSPLILTFQDQRLRSVDTNQFEQFLAAVTDTPSASFDLTGAATVLAATPVGELLITNISLDVSSELKGINSFDNKVGIENVTLVGSTPDYMIVELITYLNNPSNITLTTRDLYIPAFFKEMDLGRVLLDNVTIVPGTNMNPATFFFWPADSADPRSLELIGRYMTPDNNGTGGTSEPMYTPLHVGGVPDQDIFPESPYDSLLPALWGFSMPGQLPGIGTRLVVELDLSIDVLEALRTNGGSATLILHNTLPTGLTLMHIRCDVWKAGEENQGDPDLVRAQVDTSVEPPQRIGPGETIRMSLPFMITRGLFNSLDLLGHDLSIDPIIEVMIDGGYVIPGLPYPQYDIHSTYQLDLLGASVNVTEVLGLLPGMMNALTPRQVADDLAPALAQVPESDLRLMARSINDPDAAEYLDPTTKQRVCDAIPVIRGLLECQPSVELLSAHDTGT